METIKKINNFSYDGITHNLIYFFDFYEFHSKIRQNNFGDCELCHITAKFEADEEVTRDYVYDYFMEIGYLFLESDDEKKIIFSKIFLKLFHTHTNSNRIAM